MHHTADISRLLIKQALACRKIAWEHTVAGTSGSDDWRAPLETA